MLLLSVIEGFTPTPTSKLNSNNEQSGFATVAIAVTKKKKKGAEGAREAIKAKTNALKHKHVSNLRQRHFCPLSEG